MATIGKALRTLYFALTTSQVGPTVTLQRVPQISASPVGAYGAVDL